MNHLKVPRLKLTSFLLISGIGAVSLFGFIVYYIRHTHLPQDQQSVNTHPGLHKASVSFLQNGTFLLPVPEHAGIGNKIKIPVSDIKGPGLKDYGDTLQDNRHHAKVVTQYVNTVSTTKIAWDDFVKLPLTEHEPLNVPHVLKNIHPLQPDYKPVLCSAEIVDRLSKPTLSPSDVDWCKWATSTTGGKVVVGKSWGDLAGSTQDRLKFDALNCNAVNAGKNPSCDDSWGDIHIGNWRKSKLPEYNCDASKKSRIHCSKNENSDKFCVMENVQFDFSKVEKYERGVGLTPSKHFKNNFISSDCSDVEKAPEGLPFSHLYSPQVSRKQCDYVHNGTVLVFSHDDLRNLGHTLNDIMNVWVMLWMDGLARDSHSLDLLNIDSFKLGHNWDDQPNAFFLPYMKNMNSVLRGVDFGKSTLCIQRLIFQPLPPRFFVWESWFKDLPCSFIGPSSLFQRWNFHVRHSYNLLAPYKYMLTNQRLQVLLIVRNAKTNLWGSSQTSRNFLNLQEITSAMEETMRALQAETGPNVLVVKDLNTLDMSAQVALIGQSSILVGMHGAGIASSMHMSIGTKWCCGVIEIYPEGEFLPIKGHGNMARKMGIKYDRFDIVAKDSLPDGGHVPVETLSTALKNMVRSVQKESTCVLPAVINDPYLESVLLK